MEPGRIILGALAVVGGIYYQLVQPNSASHPNAPKGENNWLYPRREPERRGKAPAKHAKPIRCKAGQGRNHKGYG